MKMPAAEERENMEYEQRLAQRKPFQSVGCVADLFWLNCENEPACETIGPGHPDCEENTRDGCQLIL